jgi:hypothetical protein
LQQNRSKISICGKMLAQHGSVDRRASIPFPVEPGDVITQSWQDTAYEKLVTYYVKLCAVNQFRSKLTGEGGDDAGHAVGVAQGRLQRRQLPLFLDRCAADAVPTSLQGPEHGAGLGANKCFQDWVAVPSLPIVLSSQPFAG